MVLVIALLYKGAHAKKKRVRRQATADAGPAWANAVLEITPAAHDHYTTIARGHDPHSNVLKQLGAHTVKVQLGTEKALLSIPNAVKDVWDSVNEQWDPYGQPLVNACSRVSYWNVFPFIYRYAKSFR